MTSEQTSPAPLIATAIPKLTEKVTNSGSKYKVLMPSQKIIYDYVHANNAGLVDGMNNHYTAYVTKSEVCKKGFPLNANPRKPNSVGTDESKDIVVKMEHTINTIPESFVRLNNGMTAVASKVEMDSPKEGQITITWGEMEGVLNGGHTYLALQNDTCPPSHQELTKVKLEIIELNAKFTLPENLDEKTDLIKHMAMARNANRQLKDFTQSEFEGKHEIFQSHLDDLKGLVYWSEGYEDIAINAGKTTDQNNPVYWKSKECMHSHAFIRYLAILDGNWHWHPTADESDKFDAPTKETIIDELIVKGKTTYEDWKVIALLDHHDKNLKSIAPLSRLLIHLHDRITDSMNHVKVNGDTINPLGCGSNFTTMKVFTSWCGSGPSKKLKLTDFGASKTAKSTPHFIGYMLNFVRPFIWSGETEEGDSLVGWYHDPVEIYDIFHKTIIKDFMSDKFTGFDSGRDMCKDGMYGKNLVWDDIVLPIWNNHCSADPENDNFFPESFFDPESEKWYGHDENGDFTLSFDKINKGWSIEENGSKEDEEIYRLYNQISRPY